MKESWLVYDYMRRWWLLLLVCTTVGAVLGLAFYAKQVHPVEYSTIARVAIEDPLSEAERPTSVVVTIGTSKWSTAEAVVEDVTSSVDTLATYTNAPVVIRKLEIERYATDAPWWKAVVLGSVICALLAIAGIYLWEDVRAYRRTQHENIWLPPLP